MREEHAQYLERLLADSRSQEARVWLRGAPDTLRTLGELSSRAESLALVELAYAAGAQRVTAVEIDEYADRGGAQNTGLVVVSLPGEAAPRGSVFEWAAEMLELMGLEAEADVGQQHLLIPLD